MTKMKADLRPAWRNYWPAFVVILGLLTMLNDPEVAGLALTSIIIIALAVVLRRYSLRYTISGDRVQRHYGLIARNQQGVRVSDLRSVEISQGPVQRILGVGALGFYTAGSGKAEVTFTGIMHPASWRDRIESAIDESKASA